MVRKLHDKTVYFTKKCEDISERNLKNVLQRFEFSPSQIRELSSNLFLGIKIEALFTVTGKYSYKHIISVTTHHQ
jgi:hypothetical protein